MYGLGRRNIFWTVSTLTNGDIHQKLKRQLITTDLQCYTLIITPFTVVTNIINQHLDCKHQYQYTYFK